MCTAVYRNKNINKNSLIMMKRAFPFDIIVIHGETMQPHAHHHFK